VSIHQTVNYFKPAVWVFGGLISLLSYASYHSAEESRKQIYCAMQREQQACNVMRQQFESFERMLDCLFDTTCWTNLDTLVHKEVSQRFAHFFTNMAGIPLEMVGFTVKDKLKFHQLLEDAKRAEGKRASSTSFTLRCRACPLHATALPRFLQCSRELVGKHHRLMFLPAVVKDRVRHLRPLRRSSL